MKSQSENQGQRRVKGVSGPQIRYLKEMKNVLYEEEWAKKSPNLELYYIWRGLKEKNGIRYDITIIPPKMLGKEFVKTKGHEHIGNCGELYKVLAGEGIFLIQDKEVKNVYFFRAKKGEFVLIPPNFSHTTINPSFSKTLKVANWISKECKSDYKNIEKKKGFCYYLTIDGWLENKNYKTIPKLKEKKPLKKMPKNLKFLSPHLKE
jgi:glucose-6-phosphate isomerase